MGENSKIEWTHHTFNPWIGCTKVAAGCTHCYAEAHAKQPLKWNAEAERAGERRRVFCASLADVFEDFGFNVVDSRGRGVPNGESFQGLNAVRGELFGLIDRTPMLDWLLLTKRPENIRRMLTPQAGFEGSGIKYRPNVWLGCSIATQEDVDRNVPELLGCCDLAPVLFLSAEPLLGPINLGIWTANLRQPLWVIVGGESGHGARPMHPAWARSLRDQCQDARVRWPFFFKQWGEWIPAPWPDPRVRASETCELPDHELSLIERNAAYVAAEPHDSGFDDRYSARLAVASGAARMIRVGKKAAGRLLDGVEHSEFPSAVSAASAFQKAAP